MPTPTPAQSQEKPWIDCQAHGHFLAWLERSAGTVITTTYNSGKLALISCMEGQLHLQVHKFARPMGLAVEPDRIALATQTSILWFERKKRGQEPFWDKREGGKGRQTPFVQATGIDRRFDGARLKKGS